MNVHLEVISYPSNSIKSHIQHCDKSKKGGLRVQSVTEQAGSYGKTHRHRHDANLACTTTSSTSKTAANTRGCGRGGLNDAVTVAQLHHITDALLSLITSEASLLDELLLKDTVLPDVVLDLQANLLFHNQQRFL